MGFRRARTCLSSIGLALALIAPGGAGAQAGGRTIYCCDVGGQPVCGDVLPAVCYGREYRELSAAGTVRRIVAAPLTADEIASRNEAERQRRIDEAERLRQLRLDQALLETYRSISDLDGRRERELGDLDRTIRQLRERESALMERQRAMIEEAAHVVEGSEGRKVLDDNIHTLDGEIVAQRTVIDAKLRERSAVLDRFEEHRQRYLELTTSAPTVQ
jgi:hypothetical protein